MKSTRDYIITFVLVIAALGVLLWIARAPVNPGSQQAASAAGLFASETAFDFGTVSMAKGAVTRIIGVRNRTTGPITIRRIYTSCMCTTATLIRGERQMGPFGMPGHGLVPGISETLASGEEGSLEIAFDPAAHGPAGVGKIERSIYVESGDGRPLVINFRASVEP